MRARFAEIKGSQQHQQECRSANALSLPESSQIVTKAATGTRATSIFFRDFLISLNANAPIKRPIINPPQ